MIAFFLILLLLLLLLQPLLLLLLVGGVTASIVKTTVVVVLRDCSLLSPFVCVYYACLDLQVSLFICFCVMYFPLTTSPLFLALTSISVSPLL